MTGVTELDLTFQPRVHGPQLRKIMQPHIDDDSPTGWVTLTAHTKPGNDRPTWATLNLLLGQDEGTRFRVRLPDPQPGARGLFAVNDTWYDLIAIPVSYRPESTWSVISNYPFADPIWVDSLPDHSRLLLAELARCPTIEPIQRKDNDWAWVWNLTTAELQDRAAPLLNLSQSKAEITAATLAGCDTTPPPLGEIIDFTNSLDDN